MLLSLEFLERYDDELEAMNEGKEGRPFTLTRSHIVFLAVVRYLFAFPYRQPEGFTRALNRLLPRLPSADYSGLRRRILGIDLSSYEELEKSGEDVAIAVDSTGVKIHKAGGWVKRKHGKKKRYVKIHLAVDVETKEALAMIVTTDGTHDSRVFPDLLRKAVTAYKRLGHRRWAKLKGYGRRWSVETAYSTFKRAFGEVCMAKTMKNITKELAAKAYIYNMLINL